LLCVGPRFQHQLEPPSRSVQQLEPLSQQPCNSRCRLLGITMRAKGTQTTKVKKGNNSNSNSNSNNSNSNSNNNRELSLVPAKKPKCRQNDLRSSGNSSSGTSRQQVIHCTGFASPKKHFSWGVHFTSLDPSLELAVTLADAMHWPQ